MAKRAPEELAKGINDVAQVLREDMKTGARRRQDITGKAFEPLEPETIRRKKGERTGSKKLKGGTFLTRVERSKTPSAPLLDTGRMIGRGPQRGATGIFISQRAKKTKLEAKITVPQDRQKIGIWHNEGAGNNPKRRFFYVIGEDRITRPRKKLDTVLRGTTIRIAESAHV